MYRYITVACLALTAAQHAVAATVIDIQPFEQTATVEFADPAGGRGTATLVNLNPQINAWYVLTLKLDATGAPVDYHLENPAPLHQRLGLDPTAPYGLSVRTDKGESHCPLSRSGVRALEEARRSGSSYAPLCDGRLYLRNPSTGYRRPLELATDFLRDHVWGGEKIITIVKETITSDAFLEVAAGPASGAAADGDSSGPAQAIIDAAQDGLRPVPAGLGIDLDLPSAGQLSFGRWYGAKAAPRGVFVSVMQPGALSSELLSTHRERVRPLDAVESKALAYLIAFDLAAFRVGYEVGTDHPRVGWSPRVLPQMRDDSTPGPDGFDSVAPLVPTGIVSPALVSRTVAAFTGGFKRDHGSFRYGELALRNRGTHYGWVQHGVVFSTLQADLATLVVRGDGTLGMQTWRTAEPRALEGIAHARQNGVPLIEPDPSSGEPAPGALVGNWGAGNWSGSAEGSLRTVRGGVCLQSTESREFLIYAYFSSATPSAMARVFQGYQCRYAMQLDMNALEHTYLALYTPGESGVDWQHLVHGMEAVDRTVGGQAIPRFIGYPDNRDFFYVVKRLEDEP